ncbi:hypothetical protein MKEN_00809500 [Mycena kentingensis (nom. inval.)]|nr:hypothetical protein MKEN_00809500 [Mycena kentingensis (nom. inval.)]
MSASHKHHRRSQSLSSPLGRVTLRTSKRALPFDPSRADIDLWRRGKRRRRTNVANDDNTMDVDLVHSSPIPSLQPFATTSAQFKLFPQKHTVVEPRLEQEPDANELARLRSEAFHSLRKNIQQTGESWIAKMQMEEEKRVNAHSPRGRRPPTLPASTAENWDEEDDDDDDVRIFAGESTPTFFTIQHRASSVDETAWRTVFHDRDRCSSPAVSSCYLSDDDDSFISRPALSPTPSSHGLSQSDSVASLAQLNDEQSGPSSRSEKAIAALSLAITNGAAGLEDYSALLRHDARVGGGRDEGGWAAEMWR